MTLSLYVNQELKSCTKVKGLEWAFKDSDKRFELGTTVQTMQPNKNN